MKPGQTYTNRSTASISFIRGTSCPWGCTSVFVLNNPKWISSEEFLSFHNLSRPPKWSVFLADFHVAWKKACFSLFYTFCQKINFVPLIFVFREIKTSTPCSPFQWDLLLHRSPRYPSRCLCWRTFQLFDSPFQISCQFCFF